MTSWQKVLKNSVSCAEQLSGFSSIDLEGIEKVTNIYPMRINPYYLGLIRQAGDPLWRQAVPDLREIQDGTGKMMEA